MRDAFRWHDEEHRVQGALLQVVRELRRAGTARQFFGAPQKSGKSGGQCPPYAVEPACRAQEAGISTRLSLRVLLPLPQQP